MLGETLDKKYELARLLGQGGMGAVYEAIHTGTGRRVAVKVITCDLSKKNSVAVSRFYREAKAVGSIDTQYVTQLLDAGTDATTGVPYLVMEYLKGEDLQQLLKRVGPLRPEVALRIVAQACIGLGKAHEARVIHRDIKPSNLFLVQKEEGEILVKILDFGIAKIKPVEEQGAETTGLTRTGGVLGSPLYMSPEQARGLKEIDYRTDLWSLGVVLYHALAGRAPHADIDAFGDLLVALCSEAPRSVQRFASWVPNEVAAVVHGALQIEPNHRYPSAAAMLDAMKSLLPDGFSLKASDLVGMTEEQRFVASKLELCTTAPFTPRPGVPSRPKLPSSSETVVETGEGVKPSPEPRESPRPRVKASTVLGAALVLASIVLGAAATLTVGVLGLHRAKVATPPEAVAGITANMHAPGILRRVYLVVRPSDASVEIDGEATPVQGDVVEIAGFLGSVHRVRIFKGKRQSTGTVVITDTGASPSEIAIERSPPEHDGGRMLGAPRAGMGAAVGSGECKQTSQP